MIAFYRKTQFFGVIFRRKTHLLQKMYYLCIVNRQEYVIQKNHKTD